MKTYLLIMALLGIGFLAVRAGCRESVRRHFDVGFFISLAFVLGVGVFTHGAVLFVAAAFATMLACRGDTTAVGCRFLGLVVLVPNVSYAITAGGTYITGLGIAGALALGALLGCLVRSRPDRRRAMTAEDGVILILVVMLGVAETRVGSLTAHLRTLLDAIISIGAPYLVLRRAVRDRADLKAVIEMIAGLALILAVVAIYETVKRWEIFDIIWANQTTDAVSSLFWNMRSGFLRAPTTFKESTAFSVFEMVGVFAVLAARRSFRSDAAWLGTLAVTSLGLLTAQSRGALIGLLIGLVTIEMAKRRFSRAVAMVALAGLLVGGVVVGARSNARLAEFTGVGQSFGNDADYRQTLLRRGMQEGIKHWALGSDELEVRASLADITTSQGFIDFVNSYLYFFLISGLAGLLPLLVSLALAMRNSFSRTSEEARDHGFQAMQSFVYGALPAVLVTLFFTSFYERNPIWLFLGLAANRVLHIGPLAQPDSPASRPPLPLSTPAGGPLGRARRSASA